MSMTIMMTMMMTIRIMTIRMVMMTTTIMIMMIDLYDDQPVPGVAEPCLSKRGNTSASLAASRMPGGW